MPDESQQEYGTLIAKKSERLVTALYLVTDLIHENEPIKRSLRANAVELITSMNTLAQREVRDKVTHLKMSLKAVTEILSLLHISVTSGLVSDMNGEILTEGFRALQLVLEKKQPILTSAMLSVDHENELRDEAQTSAINGTSYDVMTPLALARMHDVNVREIRETKEAHDTAEKESLSHKGHSKGHEEKRLAEPVYKTEERKTESRAEGRDLASSFQMKKLSRRDQILALFVKGVDVSIKDISARIKGCSEKTIQRELNALLFSGKIVRIGEKRWSRYMLR